MRKYSQNLEQQFILQFFGHRKGTFLDLGSFDGINLSNVRALAELGWKGVMVEASPTVFKELQKNYQGFPGVILLNFAVSDKNGTFDFYDNHDAVATMHSQEKERWGETQTFEKTKVNCRDIKEVLEQLGYSTFYQTYEFISIDCEGEDLTLLKRIDYDKYKTKMICVEWNGKDKHLYDKIVLPFRFRLVHKNGENLIYYR